MALEKICIQEIIEEVSLLDSLMVIKDSFITVAREFNLTEENCPSNPAFTDLEKLKKMKIKGSECLACLKKEIKLDLLQLKRLMMFFT